MCIRDRFQAKAHKTVKWDRVTCGQDITGDISIAFYENQILHGTAKRTRQWAHQLRFFYNKLWRFFNMNNVRNEIKAQIVRAGFTMQDVVDKLAEDYGCLLYTSRCV